MIKIMSSVICKDIFTGFMTLLCWNEMYLDALTHLTVASSVHATS